MILIHSSHPSDYDITEPSEVNLLGCKSNLRSTSDLDMLFDEIESILVCHTHDYHLPLVYEYDNYSIKIELK